MLIYDELGVGYHFTDVVQLEGEYVRDAREDTPLDKIKTLNSLIIKNIIHIELLQGFVVDGIDEYNKKRYSKKFRQPKCNLKIAFWYDGLLFIQGYKQFLSNLSSGNYCPGEKIYNLEKTILSAKNKLSGGCSIITGNGEWLGRTNTKLYALCTKTNKPWEFTIGTQYSQNCPDCKKSKKTNKDLDVFFEQQCIKLNAKFIGIFMYNGVDNSIVKSVCNCCGNERMDYGITFRAGSRKSLCPLESSRVEKIKKSQYLQNEVLEEKIKTAMKIHNIRFDDSNKFEPEKYANVKTTIINYIDSSGTPGSTCLSNLIYNTDKRSIGSKNMTNGGELYTNSFGNMYKLGHTTKTSRRIYEQNLSFSKKNILWKNELILKFPGENGYGRAIYFEKTILDYVNNIIDWVKNVQKTPIFARGCVDEGDGHTETFLKIYESYFRYKLNELYLTYKDEWDIIIFKDEKNFISNTRDTKNDQ
ncbi:hypothetical protein [Escherichia phage BF17]|nr:hypothetical protein [Escherichia phage BF17]